MTDNPRTIPQVLDRIADQFSDHDALVTDDRRFTYSELRTDVRRAAAALIDLGVNAGDRVAICPGADREGRRNVGRIREPRDRS
jgi:non-ribosomal peptide synthetase component E (peptide arylation enzyme)